MTEIERLRRQAAKARQLLMATSDKMARSVLHHYAEECDEEADRLEEAGNASG